MKQRLPLASIRPSVAPGIDLAASGPAERVWLARPLVCVANPPSDAEGLRFARSLIESVRARGRAVAAWAPASEPGSARALAALDARSIELAPQLAWWTALGDAIDALPADCLVVALGREPAVRLRALLSVEVVGVSAMRAAETRTASSIDLYLGREAERVALLIGAQLALDSSIISHTESRRSL